MTTRLFSGCLVSSPGNREKQIPEGNWRRGPLALRHPMTRSSSGHPSPLGADEAIQWGDKGRLGPSPLQPRSLDATGIKPGRLSGAVPIVPLLDVTRHPSLVISADPSTLARWLDQAEIRPSMRPFRVHQHAPPLPHGGQSRLEAPTVIAEHQTRPGGRRSSPIPPPACARWVGHHRPRAPIGAGIPSLIPRINPRQVEIRPAGLDEESGNHQGSAAER